jgi:hypothetical protein
MPKTIETTRTARSTRRPMPSQLVTTPITSAIAIVMKKFSETRVCSRTKPPRSRSTR